MVEQKYSFVDFTVGVLPQWEEKTTSDENFQKIRGLKASAMFYDDLQVDNTKAPYVLDVGITKLIPEPANVENGRWNPYLGVLEAISQGHPLTMEKF